MVYKLLAWLALTAIEHFKDIISDTPLDSPTISLSYGTVQGSTQSDVSSFLGIPYAQPPLGDLRFTPPQPPQAFDGIRQATNFSPACPQQNLTFSGALPFDIPIPIYGESMSEDCLYIYVYKPATARSNAKLPVVFHSISRRLYCSIGAYEMGDAALYPGTAMVKRSIALGEPVIFVSHNYRLNAFGFLASQEVIDAGHTNIGMRDQRFALEWVQHHISAFGGDPNKVIIWGFSAGSWSVGFHLVLNGGDNQGLFRGAVMESGSTITLRNYTDAQPFYNVLVEHVGCTGEPDTLACLRHAPYDKIMAGVNATPDATGYRSLDMAWQPRLDGDMFVGNPMRSVQMGLYAKVPLISGVTGDEGTLFSLGNKNITTDEQFLEYVHSTYIPAATASDLEEVSKAYSSAPGEGSPFGTGDLYTLTPQFKRIAAFTGDWMFVAPHRFLVEQMSKTQDVWAYLFNRMKSTPFLGSLHASDVTEFFGNSSVFSLSADRYIDFAATDAIINFATHLNPNAPAGLLSNMSFLSKVTWDKWSEGSDSHKFLTFMDPAPSLGLSYDMYRADSLALLNRIALDMP
ncbi:sterol esterase [Wolfiporia cocos MD-104 SS10]|uniref:Carboxylic ester hydrolase n=1 Tax=Wolfiporia cocos (strain MD-104) TaxID=742152 RepID=A0A2H3J8N2_WOLCO|nr:sterol esterase [Wolfiporia cocos MD-104 SS10]